jgi:hypothetical protein
LFGHVKGFSSVSNDKVEEYQKIHNKINAKVAGKLQESQRIERGKDFVT